MSGHEKGYAWAHAHGIVDPDYSNGNSQSFNEGCRRYARERLAAADAEARAAADNWRAGRLG